MACNHCGYNAAIAGSNCPACGKHVSDPTTNMIVVIGIIVILAIFLSVLIGPAYLLYKAYKTSREKRTNWWLIGGLILSLLLITYSDTIVGTLEGDNDFSAFVPYVFYINLMVFLGAITLFFLRLKENQYQIKELFI